MGILSVVQASPLGVTAKVADFGLSRDMLCASKIETRTCGTITHMPPELLSSDVMSKVGSLSNLINLISSQSNKILCARQSAAGDPCCLHWWQGL